MPYVAALTVLFMLAWLYRERMYDKQNEERERAWRLERTGLLTRIQHPEIVVGEAQEIVIPDEELRNAEIVDDIDLVGTIQVNGSNESD